MTFRFALRRSSTLVRSDDANDVSQPTVSDASVWQGWERGDCQLVRRFVKDEFQAADVTAIHAPRFGQVAVVGDLALTGRTLPRHSGSFCRTERGVCAK
jgi:hypothetical protein